MNKIVLINQIEVPKQEVTDFLERWKAARDFMKKQPGFISASLRRCLSWRAAERFVSISEWRDFKHLNSALSISDFVIKKDAYPYPYHAEMAVEVQS